MRQAVFAGSFYSADPKELQTQFAGVTGTDPVQAIGVIAPHAGYVYSGKTAWRTLSSVEIPGTVVVLCPNHRGLGLPVSISPDLEWDTPLGPVPLDRTFAGKLADSGVVEWDRDAHRMEHSLEVQLPLLKMMNPEVRIVPVCIGTGDTDKMDRLAEAIAAGFEPGRHLMLASSDMSHFLSAEMARKQDAPVIQRILELDYAGMLHQVLREGVSMCGVYPAYVMIQAARTLGASRAEVIEYTHSGVVTGDHTDVVAYLGVRIW